MPGDTTTAWPTNQTIPGSGGGVAKLDPATAKAIEERTWHRGPVVFGLDPATAKAIEERTWPLTNNTVIGFEHTTTTAIDELRSSGEIDVGVESGPRYELGKLIGRGGMGEVYAAYDAQLGREVAIKRLHQHKVTPGSLARFVGEARIQGWLDHPAIPSVYELGRDGADRPFFVMKKLSGVTLEEILTTHEVVPTVHRQPSRFTEQQLLRAFVEICLTIEFAHTRGVLHRDLKPANMLLGEFGEVYVLDWGIARVLDRDTPRNETMRQTLEQVAHTAGTVGTPGYMSPEQVCDGGLDARSDVYALGCVLFEILTGRRLHPAGFAGMTSALAGVTDSPSSYRHDVAPELDDLCRRATATERGERVASARALGEAVQRYLDGDRDLALRRKLARSHLETAGDAASASLAMREAGRALALDPTLPGAAELVGRLMIQPPTGTPAAVVAELEESKITEQRRMAKSAIGLYAAYACLAPLLFAFGIRDVFYLCALLAIASGNIAIASATLFRRRSVPRIAFAIGHVVMFALIARMFTPLFIAPGLAAVTLTAYAQHPASTHRRELLVVGGFAIAAVLGMLGAEACGWISATTVVNGGVVELIPPLDGVAQFPIIPALCCYAIVLVAVAVGFTSSTARHNRDARRKLHVQTWQLRQLTSLDEIAHH